MIEPAYVPYEQYRAAKTRCRLDSRIYGRCVTSATESSVFTTSHGRYCASGYGERLKTHQVRWNDIIHLVSTFSCAVSSMNQAGVFSALT
jgi:hypothetical protein